MTAEHRSRPPLGRREFVALMAMISAMQALGIDAMLPALGMIAQDLDAANDNQRQLVIGIFTVGMAIGSIIVGFLSDRFGRRVIVLVALIGYALTNLLCAMADTFVQLLVFRFINGMIAAAGGVMSITIVRDRFDGDEMARVQSLVAIVFMAVPIFAPGLGQLVLLVAGWEEIFIGMAALAAGVALWAWLRLPETLSATNRQSMELRLLARSAALVAKNRDAVGYVVGAALVFGGLIGFINSAQQLMTERFGAGNTFPVLFGLMASSLILTNFVNSRIVERFGARPVSHFGLIAYIVTAGLQLCAALFAPASLPLFVVVMMCNLALFGFLGANFTSIALQPFGRIAGAASSVQTTARLLCGSLVGIAIGAAYDGSAVPLASGMFAMGIIGIVAVAYSERWRLFRRRSGDIDQV